MWEEANDENGELSITVSFSPFLHWSLLPGTGTHIPGNFSGTNKEENRILEPQRSGCCDSEPLGSWEGEEGMLVMASIRGAAAELGPEDH